MLDQKALFDSRQRSPSAVDTVVSAEADLKAADSPFDYSPDQLNQLLNPKSLDTLNALGGLEGLARGLHVDVNTGLSVDEVGAQEFSKGPADARFRAFGRNQLPPKKPKSIWRLAWITLHEAVLIMLTVAGAISLALGLYETFGVPKEPGAPASVDWVEGVAILAAVLIVVVVASHNDWQKEKAFVKLNTKKDDREVKVLRSGKSMLISVHDVVVGDVLYLEPGDLVPVDGIFINGHNVKCDESSATGESDALRKTPGAEVFDIQSNRTKEPDPFIISGSRVVEVGMGTFLCTAVGVNSSFGKIMMSVRTDTESTPLQRKLEGLAVAIAKLGGGASLLMFFILLFRFCASLPGDNRPPEEKASTFVDLLVVAIAIIAVAVPEGLPLAVTLALAFATTRLLKENNLVRVLRACETMGNATCICSDKTGTLTTNKMTVVAGRFGASSFTSDIPTWASTLSRDTKQLITQSVAINSTAFEGEQDGAMTFVGSKTETALLQLAKDHLGMQSLPEARANEQVVLIEPFDSVKKYMVAVIKVPSGYRLLIKGASEIVLGFCSSQKNVSGDDVEPVSREAMEEAITAFARKSLRTLGIAYQDFETLPDLKDLSDLTLLGIVGIQDPVRPGVPAAVQNAKRAGVTTRMVTGDNIITARAIAAECGIFTDGIIIEGPEFRRLSEEELDKIIPRLQVLARSSPEDKRSLVTRLKALGETVAVTGDGTNDAPALKAADVGFSMGISGTEVAKEASDIILMDDNFTSIVTALKWGRAVNDAVQKFLQFQITVNITAVILSFVTSMSDDNMEPVLKAVQLLWINLIMDTMAALALATDPPTDAILDRPPQPKSAPLITMNMWKMIIGQSIFQLVVTLVLYFSGGTILNYDVSIASEKLQLDTIIFNVFVWMQIFNELNCRRLDNKFNVFAGVHRNWFFIAINLIMIGLQIAIVFVGNRVFDIQPHGLDGPQWAISILIALFSLPWGVAVRVLPDEWFAKAVYLMAPPFVIGYRLMAEGFCKFGRLFKRTRDANQDGEKLPPGQLG
ncbi:calcium-translocating P-type ATPase [Aspergillus steynii IBT 23096]|uniref:Calcium-transporting ATPase n=1 Tax=Aspergillus steynii IBT 23096 TaxID=1392250 RepID=A0A2I2GM64_9EURO|nr:calcium-translocating P-type ATPase [Aspergillus steynii IBT 23096]PLB53973.1 calcium-translocating P-type ATPase [Aspergillus steynii IBT 23096]